MEDLIFNSLSQFGFPIAICFYLMARVVRAVDKNTTAIESLREDIHRFLHR